MPKLFDQWKAHSPYYNESHTAWGESVRRFVSREVSPFIDQWEADGELPRALHKTAADTGILGMGFPEEYGGVSEGLDGFHGIVFSMEMAEAASGGLLAGLMVHSVALRPIIALGSDEMKARVAPAVLSGEKIMALAVTEPSGGSDVANLKTRAERVGDHYVVNGSKTFITSGMRADYYTVAVRTGGPGAEGVSLLLVEKDAPGFSRTKLDKMGWHCSDTATLHFDNVRVPVENLIGAEGQAFRGMMKNFNGERLGIATTCCAFAMVALEEALSWAQERTTFGKKLIQHQVVRQKLADMTREIYASLAWVERCTLALDAGRENPAEIALLKVQATRMLEYVAREACQILGGAGFMRGVKSERIFRETRPQCIGGGTEEIMLDLAARQLGYLG